MKKVILFSICSLIFLSGCSSNSLKCSHIGTDTGKKVTTNLDVSFDKNGVTRIKEEISMKFDNEYKNSIDSIYNALEEKNKELEKNDGIKVKTVKGDDNINMNIDFDIKKYSGKKIDGLDINTKLNKKEMKKELENSGYQCK